MIAITKRVAKRALSLLPYRLNHLGAAFDAWYEELARTEAMSHEELKALQFKQFQAVVSRAYHQTTFYRRHYDAHGFHPDQLVTRADFVRIPIITKQMARDHGRDMVLSSLDPDRLEKRITSGTTGTPLSIYSTKAEAKIEWASICYQWSRVGYRPGDGRVEFRGFIATEQDFVFDAYHRVLRINIARLSQDNLSRVIERIAQSGYRFFHGYPSAIDRFATLLLASDQPKAVLMPQGILLASEVLYEWQKANIRRAFPGSRLIAHYGQAERVALGAWVEGDERYHFLPLYGLVERDAASGELVATSLTSQAMPLIRYAMTDVADGVEDSPAVAPAHLFPIISAIDGRKEDYIFKPNGEMIPPALVTFAFKVAETFTACKLIQYALDRIEILVETHEAPDRVHAEFEGITTKLKSVFGESMRFSVTLTEHIPREASGKFKWIESRL